MPEDVGETIECCITQTVSRVCVSRQIRARNAYVNSMAFASILKHGDRTEAKTAAMGEDRL